MVEVDEYLADVRARCSPRTFDGYAYSIRGVLLPFMEANAIVHPLELRPIDLAALATEVRGRVKSDASTKTYLRQINVFLNWIGGRAGAPVAKAPLPRLRKKHRDVLSLSEMRKLEAAAPLERDRLIIRLACDTGARLGEIAGMRVEDVRYRSARRYELLLRGKTGERLVAVSEGLGARLREYIEHRPRNADTRALWLTVRAYGGVYEPLAPKGIYVAIKDAARRSGLETRIHPHALRHSAITRMVSSHMHPAMVSEITGVSVEVIAAHYSHPTDDDRYEAVMRFLGEG